MIISEFIKGHLRLAGYFIEGHLRLKALFRCAFVICLVPGLTCGGSP